MKAWDVGGSCHHSRLQDHALYEKWHLMISHHVLENLQVMLLYMAIFLDSGIVKETPT